MSPVTGRKESAVERSTKDAWLNGTGDLTEAVPPVPTEKPGSRWPVRTRWTVADMVADGEIRVAYDVWMGSVWQVDIDESA